MHYDSTRRPIKIGDRLRFRGKVYTLKEFGPPEEFYGVATLVFEEPEIHTTETPHEINVDLVDENQELYKIHLANYTITRQTDEYILIRDEGPWDFYQCVTNAAESVVAGLVDALHGRRLYYIDIDGRIDEIRVEDGKFAGFAPGPKGMTA